MYVKIARLGQRVVETLAEVGDVIANVLEDAGVEFNSSSTITVNGVTKSVNDTLLANGEVTNIILTNNVKGGAQFLLKIAYAGGSVAEVLVESGWTVGQAIEAANFDAAGKTITLDGVSVDTATLLDGTESLVALTANVKGGK